MQTNEIERAAGFEPGDVLHVHRVLQRDDFRRTVLMLYGHIHRTDRIEFVKIFERDGVAFFDLLIVRRIDECERQNPLLLQVRLVNASKAASDNGETSEIARRHRGMLAARAFTVVLIANNDPALAACFVITRDCGTASFFSPV